MVLLKMILLQRKTKNENAKSIHEKIKNLPKKSYNKKTLPLEVRIKIKTELAAGEIKNMANLRYNSTKMSKRKGYL